MLRSPFVSPYLLLAITALCTIIAYWPGLSGGFVLDDHPNIVLNQALTAIDFSWHSLAAAASSSEAGPAGRPVAMLSFALNHLLGGLDPFGYKAANLAIHLLNAGLVFLLLQRILAVLPCAPGRAACTHDASRWLAACIALLWAAHPLNLSTVLYVVQRMTSLSTSFMLISLLTYLSLRLSGASSRPGLVGRLLLLASSAVAAFYSKESALLLPVYALALEWGVLRFRTATHRGAVALKAGYALAVLVPLAWLLWHWLADPAWLAQLYQLRSFTLTERLLTEGRVLWFYLREIFMPQPSVMGLYHDDFPLSTGLLTPATTLLALLGHLVVIVSAWMLRLRWPYLALAAAWFYGGHLLESTLFPLELVFEHRNYLPILGPLLLAGVLAWGIAGRLADRLPLRALLVSLLAVPLLLATGLRANQWADPLTHALSEAEHHPNSARANYAAGSLLLNALFRQPHNIAQQTDIIRAYLLRAAQYDAAMLEPFVAGLQLQAAFGTPLPPDFHARFVGRLRHGVPPGNYSEIAFGLNDLRSLPYRQLSDAELRAIYDAALANPRLRGKNRGHMLVAYALFLTHQTAEHAAAAQALDEAIRLLPQRQDLKVIAVNVALQLGRPERAAALIAAAEAADTSGLYRPLIGQARAKLQAYLSGLSVR